MTGRRRLLLIAGGLLCAALTAAPVFANREVRVGTTRESWYLVTPPLPESPVAGAPATPAAPPVNPYPEGTLHVGVTAGQEDSRSYLALDLADLDGGAGNEIVDGTLTLPVDPDGGTRGPEAAQIRLCRSDGAGDGERGSTAPPPTVECTIGSPARYVADRGVFEVDLGPLVGFLDRGLAIVPAAAATESAWHVAFHANDSEAADAEPIRATLVLVDGEEVAAPIISASPPTLESTTFASDIHPESAGSVVAPDVGIGQSFGPAPRGSANGNGADSTVDGNAAVSPVSPIAATGTDGFRYSVVFALPLLLLVGVPYFGHALTGPVAGQRRRDSRALKSS